MEKKELQKWQIWPIRLFHRTFCCSDWVLDTCFILNNELWNKFLLGQGHVGIVREVLQKLVCTFGVSILNTIWQTLCSYAVMHKIFIAQKSHCACHVLSLATIWSKYYFNFFMNRTRSGWELFDHPSYHILSTLNLIVLTGLQVGLQLAIEIVALLSLNIIFLCQPILTWNTYNCGCRGHLNK